MKPTVSLLRSPQLHAHYYRASLWMMMVIAIMIFGDVQAATVRGSGSFSAADFSGANPPATAISGSFVFEYQEGTTPFQGFFTPTLVSMNFDNIEGSLSIFDVLNSGVRLSFGSGVLTFTSFGGLLTGPAGLTLSTDDFRANFASNGFLQDFAYTQAASPGQSFNAATFSGSLSIAIVPLPAGLSLLAAALAALSVAGYQRR